MLIHYLGILTRRPFEVGCRPALNPDAKVDRTDVWTRLTCKICLVSGVRYLQTCSDGTQTFVFLYRNRVWIERNHVTRLVRIHDPARNWQHEVPISGNHQSMAVAHSDFLKAIAALREGIPQ